MVSPPRTWREIRKQWLDQSPQLIRDKQLIDHDSDITQHSRFWRNLKELQPRKTPSQCDYFSSQSRFQGLSDRSYIQVGGRFCLSAVKVHVVGLSCRFPGADTPGKFWRMLVAKEGGSSLSNGAVSRFDRDDFRFNCIEPADWFDNSFFNLSLREAAVMDPRQRIMLELAWEAIEDAGVSPSVISSSRVGVFIGSLGDSIKDAGSDSSISGSSSSFIANRISHFFGFDGPSVVVDTGQSSSLAAMHLSYRELRSGDIDIAIVGGVHLVRSHDRIRDLGRLGVISAGSECRPFDEQADGFVPGEGGGVVLLMTSSSMESASAKNYAEICGTAAGGNGANFGIIAPDANAQAKLIQRALADAEILPDDIGFIEAHGTATAQGDATEATALGDAIGSRRTAGPLVIGSVKANIGHLDAAAGIAGAIKAVLSLWHQRFPGNRNFTSSSDLIDLSGLNITIPTDTTELINHHSGSHSYGRVSSFGLGGANFHVILGSSQKIEPGYSAESVPHDFIAVPWVVSARSVAALSGQARLLREFLLSEAGADADAVSVGRELLRRSRFEHRAVIIGADRQSFLDGLDAVASGGQAAHVIRGVTTGASEGGKTVLVFPGQGAQWIGMGKELMAWSPVFASAMAECAGAIDPLVQWSLLEVLSDDSSDWLGRVEIVQPVSFAVMVSLARVWQSLGVVADAVMGHSQGEVAAAVVAGALSLADGARIVVARSALIAQGLAGNGAMASVSLPLAAVATRLGAGVEIAAVNGPASIVVAGETTAVAKLLAEHERDEVQARSIAVDYASHTAQVESVRDALLEALGAVDAQPSRIPLYSTVTGQKLATETMDARYWFWNLRKPVQLQRATEAVLDDGFTRLLEVSTHPVLTIAMQDTADAVGSPVRIASTLRRGEDGSRRLILASAALEVTGVGIDWEALLPTAAHGCRIRLNTDPLVPGEY